jgi:hypothetical protein
MRAPQQNAQPVDNVFLHSGVAAFGLPNNYAPHA